MWYPFACHLFTCQLFACQKASIEMDSAVDINTIDTLYTSARYTFQMQYSPLFVDAPVHTEPTEISHHPHVFYTDDDTMFVVDYAYVVLYSIRLGDCSLYAKNTANPVFHSLLDFFVPSALAGHSDIDVPTNWQYPYVVDLLKPQSVEIYREFREQSVCDFALTFARADEDTNGIELPPVDRDIIGSSLLLHTTCIHPQGRRSMLLQTSIPSERVERVSVEGKPEENQRYMGDLSIIGYTENMFHGVGCDTEENVASLQVLLNLQRDMYWTWSVVELP